MKFGGKHFYRAALVVAAFCSLPAYSRESDFPNDTGRIGTSAEQTVQLFQAECSAQRHADWARERFLQRVEACGGAAEDCARRLGSEVSWPVSSLDSQTLRVSLNWFSSQTLLPPAGSLDCSVFMTNTRAEGLLGMRSGFAVAGRLYVGPTERDPYADYAKVFAWTTADSNQANVELARWTPVEEYQKLRAANQQGVSRWQEEFWEAFLKKHEAAPWQLRFRN